MTRLGAEQEVRLCTCYTHHRYNHKKSKYEEDGREYKVE